MTIVPGQDLGTMRVLCDAIDLNCNYTMKSWKHPLIGIIYITARGLILIRILSYSSWSTYSIPLKNNF